MSTTLETISRETGFSVMTVSRALRGIGRVKVDTRERILTVAKDLGYPGLDHVVMPRAIRRGRADHQLSLVLPVLTTIQSGLDSELGQEVLAGLRERLVEIGGKLRIVDCSSLEQILAECEHDCHGLVLRQRLPTAWIDVLKRKTAVVYAVSQDFQSGVDSIYTNEHRSAAKVLDYLTSYGHEHIAWFGLVDRHDTGELPQAWLNDATVSDWRNVGIHGPRYAAWAHLAYCQLDQQRQPMLLLERDWHSQPLDEVVADGLRHLLGISPRPMAVVVPSDAMGIALVKAIRGNGLRVPDDISVLSYGGSAEGQEHVPPLTSISLPMRLIGRTIPELIERRMANPAAVAVSMQLETTLSEGGTVANLR